MTTRSFPPTHNDHSVIPSNTHWHSVIPANTHMTPWSISLSHSLSVIPSNAHAQHLHTRTHTTACHTGSGSHTRFGVRPTSGPCLSREARSSAPWAHLVREREGESGGLWAGLLSRAGLHTQPAKGLSQHAELQAELTREAKPSLDGPRAGPTAF
jgi:hypothetical protein